MVWDGGVDFDSRDLWGPWSNQGVGSMKHGEARILGVGKKDWRQLGRSGSNAAKATAVNDVGTGYFVGSV